MKITREWAFPNKYTFEIIPIKEFIKKNVNHGIVVDPFANKASIANHLRSCSYVSNDLDNQYKTDYHLDALEFLKLFEDNSVDVVLFDPPYSPRQVSESYKALGKTVNKETTQSTYWTKLKSEIARITKIGGICISFGWNSGGIGLNNGFEIESILIVAHGGWHNDTICTMDRKNIEQIRLF